MVTAIEVTRMFGVRGAVALPFHPSHLSRLEVDRVAEAEFMSLDNLKHRAEEVAEAKIAWTVFHDLNPALCFGITPYWPGMAEAWMIPSQYALDRGLRLTRGARRFFDTIGPVLDLRRLQIVVCVDREKAVSWAEFLQFQREGLMRKYGPEGSDYYMYARTY